MRSVWCCFGWQRFRQRLRGAFWEDCSPLVFFSASGVRVGSRVHPFQRQAPRGSVTSREDALVFC